MSDTEQTYGYNHELDEDDPEEDECEFCGMHVDDCICDPDEDGGIEAAERAAYNDRHG